MILPEIDSRILIEGDEEAVQHVEFADPSRGIGLLAEIRAMRLGPSVERDVIYPWGPVVDYAADEHKRGIEAAVPVAQRRAFTEWIIRNPIDDR